MARRPIENEMKWTIWNNAFATHHDSKRGFICRCINKWQLWQCAVTEHQPSSSVVRLWCGKRHLTFFVTCVTHTPSFIRITIRPLPTFQPHTFTINDSTYVYMFVYIALTIRNCTLRELHNSLIEFYGKMNIFHNWICIHFVCWAIVDQHVSTIASSADSGDTTEHERIWATDWLTESSLLTVVTAYFRWWFIIEIYVDFVIPQMQMARRTSIQMQLGRANGHICLWRSYSIKTWNISPSSTQCDLRLFLTEPCVPGLGELRTPFLRFHFHDN